MRAYEVQGSFGVEQLKWVERESAPLSAGQVRIKLRAVSLNYRDLLMVQGLYNPKQPLPLIPCSDGVGMIEEIGEGVTRFAVGDRVCPIFAPLWTNGEPTYEKLRATLGGPLDGVLAEEIVLSQEGVTKAPEHLTDAEAACLPCAALTAWSSLVTLGQIKAGDTVLLQGTGGVSIFGLQFAKMMGAETIVTSSSDEKLEKARTLGADHCINYRTTPDWGKQVRALFPQGVDHIVEVGGANTLKQSLRAIRIGGHVSLIGVLSGVTSDLNVLPILMQQVRLQGVLVGHREGFEAMNRAVALHKLRPVVDRIFPTEEAQEAFHYLAAGKHFGKVCIAIG